MTQAEISEDVCAKWLEGYKRNMTWSGPLREHDDAIVDAAIAHLRHLQEVGTVVEELSMLVKRLAHALRKSAPDNELSEKALDYLKCNTLGGTPLRRLQDVKAELEKCRRDAERYRWIRDNEQLVNAQLARLCGDGSADDFDAGIDASISAGEVNGDSSD